MEQFANSAQTTLTSSINNTSNPVTFNVASTAPFSGPNFRILIDNELMEVTAVGGGTLTATRGIEGAGLAGHSIGAVVTQVLTAAALEQLKADAVTPPLTLAPGTDSTKALILRQHSATQTGNLLECEESSGTLFGAAINGQGEFTSPNPPGASGAGNERFGKGALASLTTGKANVGIGYLALVANTSGYFNTAVGYQAMKATTSGYQNIAIGPYALGSNTSGTSGLAVGYLALENNTSGINNLAVGVEALGSNQTGGGNVGFGSTALFSNVSGNVNTAIGNYALPFTTGDWNLGVGIYSGYHNTSGTYNTFVGSKTDAAAGNLSHSTALGAFAAITSSHQVILGTNTETVVIPGDLATISNTPSVISANTNDYVPGDGAMQRWSASGSFNVTGMVAGSFDGETRIIWNVGSNTITLTNQDAASSAANRWLTTTGGNLALSSNRVAFAQYDMTSTAWRITLLP